MTPGLSFKGGPKLGRYQQWERIFQARKAKAQAQRNDAEGLGDHKQHCVKCKAPLHMEAEEVAHFRAPLGDTFIPQSPV